MTQRAPAARARTHPDGAGATALFGLVALLTGFGLLMVMSASSVHSLRESGSSWVYFQRQATWVTVGATALVLTARLDYRVWRRLALPLLALSTALLVVVLLPGIGLLVNGSRRWIDLGFVQLQPSELAKLSLLVFCADVIARRGDRHGAAPLNGGRPDPVAILKPVLVVLGGTVLLVMLEPDLGTTAVIAGIVLTLLFVGGTPLAWMAALVSTSALAAFVLGIIEPYRRARLLSFLDPFDDASHTGYQVVQSLVGLGSGQLTGVGLGESRAKWGFLPNAHTDFIFTIIGEELGLLGSVAVLVLFAAFAFLGVRISLRAPDAFGMLLAAGATAWVVGQALVNIGAVLGVLPVTGVPLPFVSSGGSALLAAMAATGVLLSVARASSRPRSARRRAAQTRHPAAVG